MKIHFFVSGGSHNFVSRETALEVLFDHVELLR